MFYKTFKKAVKCRVEIGGFTWMGSRGYNAGRADSREPAESLVGVKGSNRRLGVARSHLPECFELTSNCLEIAGGGQTPCQFWVKIYLNA